MKHMLREIKEIKLLELIIHYTLMASLNLYVQI